MVHDLIFKVALAMSAIVLAAWLTTAGLSPAFSPDVKDNAEYFSNAAVETAREEIAAIKQRYLRETSVVVFEG